MRNRLAVLTLLLYLLYLPCKYLASNYLEQTFPTAPTVSVNQDIPDLEFRSLDGNKQSISDSLSRGHIVVLNFWATWCVACQQELPALNSFYDKYSTRGVDLIAVSVDTDSNVVGGWLHGNKIKAPVWIDSESTAFSTLGLNALPSTIVIDPNGKVLAVRNSIDQIESEVEKWIKQ